MKTHLCRDNFFIEIIIHFFQNLFKADQSHVFLESVISERGFEYSANRGAESISN